MTHLARSATLVFFLLVLAACTSGPGTRFETLERTLYDYSGAIRWGQFEAAYAAIDPKRRETDPLSDFEFERLKQIQVTRYEVVAQSTLPDGRVAREIEISVINRHTQAERVVRVRESWRYDEVSGQWWQTEGLPTFAQER